jgi:CBS domain-containing protein
MIVSAFMIPADKVATCYPTDTIVAALDLLVTKQIGTVVVLHKKSLIPVGIVTKSDFANAYRRGISLDAQVATIMGTNLMTIQENESGDAAAKKCETARVHHLLVLDDNGWFKGVVSSWDIAAECAKDARAWPWNRSPDGKFHMPNEKKDNSSTAAPDSPSAVATERQPSHSFLDMIDSLRLMPDM